jgi:DHA2 family lincomycin resistance protein-like MFS transporter
LFSTVGFGATIYGFSSVGESEAGFLSPVVLVSLLLGISGIFLFAYRQLHLDEPIMDFRVFKYPMYRHAVIMFVIIIMAMFASEIILPIYMQGPLALSAATAGILLLPGSLLNGALSPFMGQLFDKVGPRPMMIPATLVLSGTMFMMSRLDTDSSVWMIVIGFLLLMVSVSAIMMPAQTNGLNQLPKRLYPHGTAVISTLQPIAGAIGVSVFISILNARQANYLSNTETPDDPATIDLAMVAGVELVYFTAFIFSIVAVVMALRVYRARPDDITDTKVE